MLEAAGADLSRTVMSHIDRTMFSDDALLQLAKRGCYLEYDLFGIECSHYQVKYIHCIYVTQKEARQVNALVQSEKKNTELPWTGFELTQVLYTVVLSYQLQLGGLNFMCMHMYQYNMYVHVTVVLVSIVPRPDTS